MLEIQANGDKRLRTEPVKVSSLPYTAFTNPQLYIYSIEFSQTKVHNKQPRQAAQDESSIEVEQTNTQEEEDDGWEVAGRGKNKSFRAPQPVQQPVQESLQDLSLEEAKDGDEEKNGDENGDENAPVEEEMPEDDDEDSDAGEWITPDNVIEKKAAELGHKGEGKMKKAQVMQAACITADFAMQVSLLHVYKSNDQL